MHIVPVITSAEKKWIFNSWDNFMIPRPFSKVIIKFDEAIYIPNYAGKDDLEKYRLILEKKLVQLYYEIDNIWP